MKHAYLLEDEQIEIKALSMQKRFKCHVYFNKPILYEVCTGICMSEYRNEIVKTFTVKLRR